MKSYKTFAFRTVQKNKRDSQIFTGKIRIMDLLETDNSDRDIRFRIHQWKSNQGIEKGYQRAPDSARIEKIKFYLQQETENPIFPTSILVNARKPLKFYPLARKSSQSDFGELLIDQTLYIIDGQHRIEAFKDLMGNRELKSKYGYIELPIIILSNFDYGNEVEQFFVINSRQKPIKTDLAQRIYMELSKKNIKTKLIKEKDRWQLPALTVVDELNKDEDSEWFKMIALPDDDKDLKKERVITQNSFITSLKPFFIGANQKWEYTSATVDNGHVIVEECKKLINEYWKMISEVWPEVFEEKKKYSLFKTVGVYSLHIVLATYLDDHSDLKPKESMSKIKELLEVARDANRMTSEFWEIGVTGPRGGLSAGAYSSSEGHNRIASAILQKRSLKDF